MDTCVRNNAFEEALELKQFALRFAAKHGSRLAIARSIQKRIAKLGVRADQAAAEALMVIELAAEGSEWPNAVAKIEANPTPDKAWVKAFTRKSA